MDAFEYLSVVVSIVLGLGIAQLLTGFGRWLEQRHTLRVYGPAIAWAGFLLLVQVQTWWTMYGLRNYETWNFLQFSAVLLQPIVLFLMSVIVFPGPNAPAIDLRENFHAQRRWFFGLLAALVVASLLKNVSRLEMTDPTNIVFHAAFFGMGVIGMIFGGERTQRVLGYAGVGTFVVYVALLYGEL